MFDQDNKPKTNTTRRPLLNVAVEGAHPGTQSEKEPAPMVEENRNERTMVDEALALAAKGFHVFACEPGGKKPTGGHGHLDASTDPETIIRSWTDTPNANIGIACSASGLAVIDVDARHGGYKTLEAREAEIGLHPDTVLARTGCDEPGLHIYLRVPPGLELKGKLGPGIDIKHHGYVIAPPSLHPSGGQYEWLTSPLDSELAEAPAAWLEAMVKRSTKVSAIQSQTIKTNATTSAYGAVAVEEEIKAVRNVTEGERNNTLNKAAFALGQLHAGGEVVDVRPELVQAAIDAGLSESEAKATVDSGWSAGVAEPRTAPSEDAGPRPISPEERQLLQEAWSKAATAGQRDRLVRALSGVARRAGWDEDGTVALVEDLAAAVGEQQLQQRVAVVEDVFRSPPARVGSWGVMRQFGLAPASLPSLVSQADAEKDSMAARLVQLVEDELEILCDQRGDAYALIEGVDGNQLLPVRGGMFRGHLAEAEFDRTGQVPGAETIRAALTIVEARARRARRVVLANRVARGEDGAIWIDMADKNGRAIRVTTDGWEIVDRPPPLFRRYAHQQPLPVPVRGGDAWKVLDFVNLPDPRDRILFVISTVTALVPDIPQPLMIFIGPQGSAKSTAACMRRRLVDPSATPTLITKNQPDEVVLALDQNYMPILDNVTAIAGWYSDILCQAVTGGSFAKRQLFTDQDQVLLTFRRPIIITALNLPRTPADLPDRALLLNFERIEATKRMPERQLWAKFEAELPSIFGGILDLLAHAMARLDSIQIPALPRMADFAQWGAAAASAMKDGTDKFLRALTDNSNQRDIMVTDDDGVGAAIKRFVKGLEADWRGTPTDLWNALTELQGANCNWREWPRRPADLSKRLTALQAVLVSQGIQIRSSRSSGGRMWEISRPELPTPPVPENAVTAVIVVTPEANPEAEPVPAGSDGSSDSNDGNRDGSGIAVTPKVAERRQQAAKVTAMTAVTASSDTGGTYGPAHRSRLGDAIGRSLKRTRMAGNNTRGRKDDSGSEPGWKG